MISMSIEVLNLVESDTYFMTCSRIQVSVVSVASYVSSIVGIILMYIEYAPSPACKLNILFITLTLGLLQIITFVSIHPKVHK